MATSKKSQIANRKSQIINVGHSPDPDDAFMFYALAKGLVETNGLLYRHHLEDIQTLNERARRAEYEVTAISIHAYAFVQDAYQLLPHGASIGDRYGPMVIAREERDLAWLAGRRVAVPGEMTTTFLVLNLAAPGFTHEVVPFDRIIERVAAGQFDAGLIIHEGQLTYARQGLHLIRDLGAWWHDETGLPLPLGGNAVRRDLGAEMIGKLSGHLAASIRYALEHRDEALAHAMRYARDMQTAEVDRFVAMYVNEWTLDYGDVGRKAVQELLRQGHAAGLIAREAHVDFVG